MINEVRNTVLSILNKNNYGYISPSDFNLFASQAQMELYEEMFSAYNKIITMENNRVSGTDYADMRRTYEEAMEIFISNKPLQNFAGSVFLMPSAITTGDEYYMMVKVICYPTVLDSGANTSVVSFQLVDSAATFTTADIVPGDLVVNTTTNTLANVELVKMVDGSYVTIYSIIKEQEEFNNDFTSYILIDNNYCDEYKNQIFIQNTNVNETLEKLLLHL